MSGRSCHVFCLATGVLVTRRRWVYARLPESAREPAPHLRASTAATLRPRRATAPAAAAPRPRSHRHPPRAPTRGDDRGAPAPEGPPATRAPLAHRPQSPTCTRNWVPSAWSCSACRRRRRCSGATATTTSGSHCVPPSAAPPPPRPRREAWGKPPSREVRRHERGGPRQEQPRAPHTGWSRDPRLLLHHRCQRRQRGGCPATPGGSMVRDSLWVVESPQRNDHPRGQRVEDARLQPSRPRASRWRARRSRRPRTSGRSPSRPPRPRPASLPARQQRDPDAHWLLGPRPRPRNSARCKPAPRCRPRRPWLHLGWRRRS
mmetsp:Transcript_129048/g.413472  ORF Transcript_129048/g.413472 Transcript_129048/m.413472 type:complete len:318 (+) Transcript_129048:1529-2482(+)